MKTISLTLALAFTGCAQHTDDSASTDNGGDPTDFTAFPSDPIQTPNTPSFTAEPMTDSRATVDVAATGSTDIETPILHCTSSAYRYDVWHDSLGGEDSDEPTTSDSGDRAETPYDVHRITITQRGDQQFAVVETGHPHDPTDIVSTVRHTLSNFDKDAFGFWLDWHGVSIYGWKNEDQTVFHGGGWGEFSLPTVETESTPAPPCGFEIELSCWEPANTQPTFKYDSKTGRCLDRNGQEGLNSTAVSNIRDTKDGECASLNWSTLNEFVPFDTELSGWNLRGAQLDQAAMSVPLNDSEQAAFVVLSNAKLEGANLSTLSVPAGVIEGTIDEHTQLPNIDCTVNGTHVDCEN